MKKIINFFRLFLPIIIGGIVGIIIKNYIDYSYTSGNNYTAPKNGYFYLRGTSGGSGAYLAISLGTASSSADYMTVKSDSGNTLCATIPVACGSIVTPTHGNITISTWRFYYAKGENV